MTAARLSRFNVYSALEVVHLYRRHTRRLAESRFPVACDGHLLARPRGVAACPHRHSPVLFYSTTGSSMSSKKLLVDVDCGVDDAQAIMMALATPNVEVLGITCVHGNTNVENVCKNTLRVLQVCNRLEIPVFRGAAKPILGNVISAGNFHGQDGLGDAPDPNAPGLDMLQMEGAVSALIRIVNENPGESWCDDWLAQESEKARFMARIFRHSMEESNSERFQAEMVYGMGFVSCDSYAMAAAIDNTFVTESDHMAVSVELTGTHTRGMMILDTLGMLKKTHKAFVMKKVNMVRFEQMMMDALK